MKQVHLYIVVMRLDFRGGQVPTLDEIATSVLLGDGESTVVTWIPSSEVVVSQGNFGEQYTFFGLDEQGEPTRWKGGSRLLTAMKKVRAQAKTVTPVKLKLTARGEAGTLKRDWEVKLL